MIVVTKLSLRAVEPGTVLLFGGLIAANIWAWAWAFAAFGDRPTVMATALLAWVFGLRHAVDADHIAAIDNVVRKQMQAGGAPRSVGLYFALGHSTIVVVATMLLALGVVTLGGDSLLKEIGGFIGTSVSALFLLVIAAINLVILPPACGGRFAPHGSRAFTTPRASTPCSPVAVSWRGCSARCSAW
ncbi:high-affinity nickel permease [Bradyrhizobium sp. F1.13.1]